MSAPKVKNLIILILLLVNLFLLALVLPARVRSGQQKQETARQLSQLFSSCGIGLAADAVPLGETLYDQHLTPDPQLAAAAVVTLLGEDAVSVQQDDGLHFSSSLGGAVLVNGSLTAELCIPVEDPETFSRNCLQKMGVEVRNVEVSIRDGNVTVCRAEPEIAGLPVVSSRIVFHYESGNLTRVEGLILSGESPMEIAGTQGSISAADALVGFLGSRLSTGWLGSRVDGMEQGWSLTRGTGGSVSLRPVWRIHTDAGVCLVNGITGAVTLQ